ncbi:hypothetical protein [Ruminiclostridium josui]|uniref:hypothetical protein n=1 Tax=Ruminiclostridium josui TaxID=1499 RepID=UPI0004B7F951|nr:hypothetical protein [Ruminiclostridium josui]
MLKITEEVIHLIEKALDIKLFPWQKDYLVNDTPFPTICPCLIDVFDTENIRKSCSAYHFDGKRCHAIGRRTGKTFAYCIQLALSDGEPIDMRKPEKYSDHDTLRYARGYFKSMFFDIWDSLNIAGLPVRELIY